MLFGNDLKVSAVFSNSWLNMDQGFRNELSQQLRADCIKRLDLWESSTGFKGFQEGTKAVSEVLSCLGQAPCFIHASFGLLRSYLAWANWMQIGWSFKFESLKYLYQGAGEVFPLRLSHLVIPGSLWRRWHCHPFLTLNKKKPEFREVQSRANVWTWIFWCEARTTPLWVSPVLKSTQTLGPAVEEKVLWAVLSLTLHPPTCFLFQMLPSFLFLTWAHALSFQMMNHFSSHPNTLKSLVCTDLMGQGFFKLPDTEIGSQ